MRDETVMTKRMMRWVGIAVLFVGYSVVAHYTYQSPRHGNLSAVLAVMPVMLLAMVLAWRSARRGVMLTVMGLILAALWAGRSFLIKHSEVVFWLQYVGIQLALFITFARTLVAGRQPLCTRFAETVHKRLTPRQEIYSRKVTVAWAIFFAVMTVAAALLFFMAPHATWSVFAHFLTLPLVASMFIGEYCVRRWALPDMRHEHILEGVRQFRDSRTRPQL